MMKGVKTPFRRIPPYYGGMQRYERKCYTVITVTPEVLLWQGEDVRRGDSKACVTLVTQVLYYKYKY